ncbi:cobalamin B12-binding domain-containing protein [Sporomusa acidovorans]|uniref:B12-binding domain-containing protein n=1 Tax=Sporomusa acidovorans (strain ATCC 49682 / DSM 3132 / Mol) TaxID=1123286 RepID=A0ABZ3J3Z3_SPOA4|nr:cobalamin-dependent protein [Sporomusa acidovorans]OZC20288.1 L-beta-lysine 5,6-aminomutase beta subunit [Sporomusa acidovorans DSM 3132]SDD39130.1 B12 binding domain-containing protein [Sporomusa acidovorans]
MKKVLLAPIDPVHDIGLKMIARGLEQAGHQAILLQPDLPVEEIIQKILHDHEVEILLLSRTLGYGVGELLARFIDLTDAVGIRERVKIGIGGMAIRPELAAELGFDAGFGPGTTVEEVICFVEDREYKPDLIRTKKIKKDMTASYDYHYGSAVIGSKLSKISDIIIEWVKNKTSPGVERGRIRDEYWDVERWRDRLGNGDLDKYYSGFCSELPQKFYKTGELHPKTRRFTKDEVIGLEKYLEETKARMSVLKLQHTRQKPLVFNQYGTGCPFMDIAHILASEAWGADGVVHFDPSWGARTEGFLDGFLTHQEDGTVITPANLNRIWLALENSTLWQIRAHRGLNTPETVVMAGKIGADLTKINICYGSLGAGTDPERMTVDGYHSIQYAQKYNLPFDIVTNEELAGVPAHKAFAGMLIVTDLAIKLGAKPILQPLFAYSPEVMINDLMDDNYVNFNAAKIYALRKIINAPVWPGAPIGFLTHTEDRVQSAMTTTLHACLAMSLGVDAISIASTDEAYSGGPISVPAKIDTLRAVQDGFRFFGHANITPTEKAHLYAEQIVNGIDDVLDKVIAEGDFVAAIHKGILGSREEGAYPGRIGKDTVKQKK